MNKNNEIRKEAITQIFSGLKRENQNELLELASHILCNQISGSSTIAFKLLPQGSIINE